MIARLTAENKINTITLFFIENQEMFSVFYRSAFLLKDGYQILAIEPEFTPEILEEKLPSLNPDILVIGTRDLNQLLIEQVTDLSIQFPLMGLALFFDYYDTEGLKLLRKIVKNRAAGLAVYLKGSITRTEQMHSIINWVRDRHYIFDPALTSLLLTEKHSHTFLKGLTRRELEVLSLISEGCTNSAIAERLYIDIKTVRHHINSIYSKIQMNRGSQDKHPRVNAARIYLETIGDLQNKNNAPPETNLFNGGDQLRLQ